VHGEIWLVIELGRDIMPYNMFTKFDQDRTKTLTKRAETLILKIKGPYFRSAWGDLAGYRTWSRYYAHQHIHQVL